MPNILPFWRILTVKNLKNFGKVKFELCLSVLEHLLQKAFKSLVFGFGIHIHIQIRLLDCPLRGIVLKGDYFFWFFLIIIFLVILILILVTLVRLFGYAFVPVLWFWREFIVLLIVWCFLLEKGHGLSHADINTKLYGLADRLLLLKCYDRKWSSYRGVPL